MSNTSLLKRIFITGIGTDVGKTIASACITEALGADYWKPIQSGTIDSWDRESVQALISNQQSVFYPETYSFQAAVSPHLAAELENSTILLEMIKTPNSTNQYLVMEGAGGLLVPLNEENTMADLIQPKDYVILVSRHYVGSINHTLLSINELMNRKIERFAVLFVGDANPSTESIIEKKANILGRLPWMEKINKENILQQAKLLKNNLTDFLTE